MRQGNDRGSTIEAKSDVEPSRKIRRSVVKDKSLSMMAHNVKIVSVNGSVTLRGHVKTEEEKAAIANKAQAIAGPGKVDNQLELRASKFRRIYNGRESSFRYRKE